MRPIALPCSLLILCTLPACGDPAATRGSGGEVTDSAGVLIVTSPATDAVYARIAQAPALSIGEIEGPEALLFSRIETVRRDADGNVIVADGASDEIRIFDPDGNHLRTSGGVGEGPGEFGALLGAWPSEDAEIVAYDMRRERITRFDPMGQVAGTAALAAPEGFGFLIALGLWGSRSLLLKFEVLPPGLPEEPSRSVVSLLRYGFDGALIDTVAHLQGPATTSVTRSRGGARMVEMLPVPFSPGPAAIASSRGLAFTRGEAYEVRFLDPAGTLGRIARLAESPPAWTDEDLAAYAQGTTSAELDEAGLRELVESFEDLPLPPTLPGYVELMYADTGELWARRYRVPGASMVRWDVFGTDGHYLGHVEIPARFTVQEASRGQLLGVARDDLDIERVQARDLILR